MATPQGNENSLSDEAKDAARQVVRELNTNKHLSRAIITLTPVHGKAYEFETNKESAPVNLHDSKTGDKIRHDVEFAEHTAQASIQKLLKDHPDIKSVAVDVVIGESSIKFADTISGDRSGVSSYESKGKKVPWSKTR